MTNDDLIAVRTFIDANAPSIVKDAFSIICKDIEEALKPSHNKQSTQGCVICGCNISLRGYCAGCQTRVD